MGEVVRAERSGEMVRSSVITETVTRFTPEGDDDELRVLCSVFDVVRDDRDVSEIQCGVYFVHEVQRSGLDKESAISVQEHPGRVQVLLTL